MLNRIAFIVKVRNYLMEKIIERYIKEIITEYPGIAAILDEYKIGCTGCSVGTCKLRDIIEIHGLSEADERALFSKIAAIIFPGQTVAIPKLPRKIAGQANQKKFSPPIKMLVDEHTNIKYVLGAIPGTVQLIKENRPEGLALAKKAIEFIRNYADKFHHAKEEEILFKLFDETTDIIATMNKEHEIGRSHVRAAAGAIDKMDLAGIEEHLTAYAALLAEHIRKEDEVLYPWMDRALTDSQVGILYGKFAEVERAFGDEPERLAAFARTLTDE
jgi:hemerythrin-like domain-containing protein